MDEVVIDLRADGTALCLWNEELDLYELGEIRVERATQIEFDNIHQRWEVTSRTGDVITASVSREAAAALEVECLQADMKARE